MQIEPKKPKGVQNKRQSLSRAKVEENKKEPQIEEQTPKAPIKTVEIKKEVITIRYDLNWFLMRKYILAYAAIPRKIWSKINGK